MDLARFLRHGDGEGLLRPPTMVGVYGVVGACHSAMWTWQKLLIIYRLDKGHFGNGQAVGKLLVYLIDRCDQVVIVDLLPLVARERPTSC